MLKSSPLLFPEVTSPVCNETYLLDLRTEPATKSGDKSLSLAEEHVIVTRWSNFISSYFASQNPDLLHFLLTFISQLV